MRIARFARVISLHFNDLHGRIAISNQTLHMDSDARPGTADFNASQGFDLYGNGGADGSRTHDLRIANATLSQLSYGPTALLRGELSDT